MVDGVILVVRAYSTPRSVIENTIAAIGKERILGTVLNHASFVADEDYYYAYRSYYSYYSGKGKNGR
jgi:Mrp family chromosome partitioning ATPase